MTCQLSKYMEPGIHFRPLDPGCKTPIGFQDVQFRVRQFHREKSLLVGKATHEIAQCRRPKSPSPQSSFRDNTASSRGPHCAHHQCRPMLTVHQIRLSPLVGQLPEALCELPQLLEQSEDASLAPGPPTVRLTAHQVMESARRRRSDLPGHGHSDRQ